MGVLSSCCAGLGVNKQTAKPTKVYELMERSEEVSSGYKAEVGLRHCHPFAIWVQVQV